METNKLLYLDHAATTPVHPAVLEAMLPYFSQDFGNASSSSFFGDRPKEAVRRARELVAHLLRCYSREVVFTSGGTESDNWALRAGMLFRPSRKRLVVSSVEHHSILETANFLERQGFQVTRLPVDETGLVSAEELKQTLDDNVGLVSIMHANNEVGTLQPLKELVSVAHEAGAFFHTDAVQTVGKTAVNVRDLNVDLLSLSAHKFYGPKGVGALYVRNKLLLKPLMYGGGQESGLRAGTLNTPGIVGLGKAAELAQIKLGQEERRQHELIETLWRSLEQHVSYVHRNGHESERVCNVLNVSFEGVESEAVVLELGAHGVAVSSRSACSSEEVDPSHVLTAMGLSRMRALSAVRFSLGESTTVGDVERAVFIVKEVVQELRDLSPLWNAGGN